MPFSHTAVPSFVEQSAAYKSALAFMQSANAKEGVDYEWVWEYAKTVWEYRNKTFAALDEKADSIIKYLGGGTGLFALGALAKVDSSNVYIAEWVLPAVVCALTAIFIAILSRMPGAFPGLPTIENAKDYADGKGKKMAAIAAFLGQWNRASEAAPLICHRKATWVAIAGWLSFAALALLLLPVAVAVHWPPCASH